MNNKQWAIFNDNKIMELALYHETKGMSVKVDTQKVFDRFMEFKRYIVRGSFTLEQLEESVYSTYGLVPASNPVNQFLSELKEMTKLRQGQEQKEQDGKAEKKEKEE
jgi:hypothetical protein